MEIKTWFDNHYWYGQAKDGTVFKGSDYSDVKEDVVEHNRKVDK